MSSDGLAPDRLADDDTLPPGQPGIFAALRIPNYRYLWLGQIGHSLALWAEQIARPVLVLEMTGSAAHLGGVVAMRTLPQLVFGLIGGVASDWFDRRTILIIERSSTLLLSSIFAALVLSGSIEVWHIYAVSLVRGILAAFDPPARQAMLPSIIPAHRLTNAIALMSATQNTMRILGTAGAGVSLALLGTGATFVAIPIIYVGMLGTTFLLHVPPHRRPQQSGLRAMGSGMVEAMRFAYSQPSIRGVLLLSAFFYTFGLPYISVFQPLFAIEVMGLGVGGVGLLASISGAGALVMALFIAQRQPSRLGVILPAVVAGFGALLFAFSLSTYLPHPAGLLLPLALIAGVGALQTTYFSLAQSMLLHAAPEEMRGRVMSLLSLDRALIAVGGAAAGFMADGLGVQPTQVIFATICSAAGVAVFVLAREFRGTRAIAPPQPPSEAPAEAASSAKISGK